MCGVVVRQRINPGGEMPAKSSGRITPQTPLVPALQAWEAYLYDQGRSPNTVKAFLSDVRLLTQFLPTDQTIGAVTTRDLDRFFRWMEWSDMLV